MTYGKQVKRIQKMARIRYITQIHILWLSLLLTCHHLSIISSHYKSVNLLIKLLSNSPYYLIVSRNSNRNYIRCVSIIFQAFKNLNNLVININYHKAWERTRRIRVWLHTLKNWNVDTKSRIKARYPVSQKLQLRRLQKLEDDCGFLISGLTKKSKNQGLRRDSVLKE